MQTTGGGRTGAFPTAQQLSSQSVLRPKSAQQSTTTMKRLIPLLLLTTILLCGHLPQARAAGSSRGVTAAKPMPVLYSFDQYAQNTKVSRTYISETMLEAAARSGSLKSDTWNLGKVLPRLTGVLMLHTHSRSTTKSFRNDQKKVSQMAEYECLMSTRADNVELQVFVRRSRGKTIQELLVFRFRDDYCTRVIQLTGKLRDSDIAEIIKMSKSKTTSDEDLLTPRGNLPEYYLGDTHDYSTWTEDYSRLVESYRAQMDSAQTQMAESLQRMHEQLGDLEEQGLPIGDYDRLLENYRQQIDEALPRIDEALPRIEEYLPRIEEYRQRMHEQRPPVE